MSGVSPSGPSVLDLANVASGSGYSLNITSRETDAEAGSRQRREEAEAKQKRILWYITYAVMLVGIALMCGFCVYLFLFSAPDDKAWAKTVLQALFSGAIGFVLGKAKG